MNGEYSIFVKSYLKIEFLISISGVYAMQGLKKGVTSYEFSNILWDLEFQEKKVPCELSHIVRRQKIDGFFGPSENTMYACPRAGELERFRRLTNGMVTKNTYDKYGGSHGTIEYITE